MEPTEPGPKNHRDVTCPICGAACFEVLHRQEFLLPGEVRTRYVVVACEACGFTFAQNLPSAEEYEAYYRSNLKYTYEGSRDTSEALLRMYRSSFEIVDSVLRQGAPGVGLGARVLDIGCSTGELLALFHRAGYRELNGVDPAPECREIARRLYGLEIETGVLSEMRTGEPYDVVLFANVLEHLPDPSPAMARVASMIREGGFLFIQLPDADNFGANLKEPFFEFSIEHINYFTEASLTNVLGRSGFTPARIRHDLLAYKGIVYPVITSVWQKTGGRGQLVRSDTAPLRAYVAASARRMQDLAEAIDALVASGEPLVIWGVGSLTARLLATTNLSQANITGFVDSNRGHHGKKLIGREIVPPASLAGGNGAVLVSSFAYGPEIRATLEQELRFAGRIITI